MKKYPAPDVAPVAEVVPEPPQVIQIPAMNIAAGAMMNLADSQAAVTAKLSEMLAAIGKKTDSNVRVKIIRDRSGNMDELIITRTAS